MGRSAGTLRNIIFGKSDSPNCSTNWIILSRVASESDKLPSIIGPCRAALSPLFTKYSSWHFQFASPAVALLKFLPTATVQQLGDLTAMSVGPRMDSKSPQAKRSSSPPLTTSSKRNSATVHNCHHYFCFTSGESNRWSCSFQQTVTEISGHLFLDLVSLLKQPATKFIQEI